MFETHKLNNTGYEEVENFKTQLRKTVKILEKLCGDSREVSLAKTKMEEAAFWGTRAIAMKKNNQEGSW
jgi:hypothetical protein